MKQHILVCLLILVFSGGARARQLALSVTAEHVDEAIRLAVDEKAARKFLQAYVIQTRSGMGDGPRIGYFSTPSSRVVLAALAARKEGKTFTATDANGDLVAPELQVLLLNLPAAYDSTTATVREVLITPRGGSPAQANQPSRRAAATSEHYRLYEVSSDNRDAIVAAFPLSALAAGNDLRVSYSHVVRGSSAVTNCKDCTVPLFSSRLR